jgi:replicative DNA helicase
MPVPLPPAATRAAVCPGAAAARGAVLVGMVGGRAGGMTDITPFKDKAAQALAEAQANRPWAEPVPLRPVVDLPGFPVEALPDWLAEYVAAEATATQTPPDLAAMLLLTALAAAAGGLAEVQLRLGWREPLNLFTATTLPPGNRKSAVFRDVTRPLVNFDRDEAARMQTIVLEAITARKVAERAADAAQATAGKATGDGADAALAEAIAAAARAEAIHVPSIPRLLADDATPEALATLLADHGRISLLSPEGGVFDMMAGRYQSGGPSLDVHLKGHAGDAIRVDRKGRPAEYVEQPR